MALTAELLKGQEALSGLTEEQVNAVVALSANDEKAVIGKTFGQIHSELDESIKSITGIGKENNEKTSDYMRRMLSSQKENIDTLSTKVGELEQKVKDGIGSEELKTQLASKDATIADLQKKYQSKSDEIKSLKEENEKTLFGYRVGSELSAAMSGIEFADGTNDAMKAFAIEKAMGIVKGMNPTFVKSADGKDVLIFKDADGVEMRDPENAMNLFTAHGLLKSELAKLGVLSTEEKGGGAGGGAPKPKQTIGGCSTKAEAYDKMAEILKSRGISRHDSRWEDEMYELTKQNATLLDGLK